MSSQAARSARGSAAWPSVMGPRTSPQQTARLVVLRSWRCLAERRVPSTFRRLRLRMRRNGGARVTVDVRGAPADRARGRRSRPAGTARPASRRRARAMGSRRPIHDLGSSSSRGGPASLKTVTEGGEPSGPQVDYESGATFQNRSGDLRFTKRAVDRHKGAVDRKFGAEMGQCVGQSAEELAARILELLASGDPHSWHRVVELCEEACAGPANQPGDRIGVARESFGT